MGLTQNMAINVPRIGLTSTSNAPPVKGPIGHNINFLQPVRYNPSVVQSSQHVQKPGQATVGQPVIITNTGQFPRQQVPGNCIPVVSTLPKLMMKAPNNSNVDKPVTIIFPSSTMSTARLPIPDQLKQSKPKNQVTCQFCNLTFLTENVNYFVSEHIKVCSGAANRGITKVVQTSSTGASGSGKRYYFRCK